MFIGLAAALLAAVLFGAIAVVQAAAIRRHGLFSLIMLGILGVYLAGWLLHLVAIARLPLYLAQVGVSASLVVTALLAAFVMGEPLRGRHWVAVVALVGGLAMLAVAAGPVGSAGLTGRATLVLYGVLLLNALLGWAAWRHQGQHAGVLLAVLAGSAYGATPVATRALVDFAWDLTTLASGAAVGLFGALGFVLYSAALRRTSVTAATAPLVLLQTAVPAVVGLVVFDDGVRSGWWPVAVAMFVVSVVAGFVLAGAEARLDLLPLDQTEPASPGR